MILSRSRWKAVRNGCGLSARTLPFDSALRVALGENVARSISSSFSRMVMVTAARSFARPFPASKIAAIIISQVHPFLNFILFSSNHYLVIRENVGAVLQELPPYVQLVAAAKSRTPEEVREAVDAGVKIIGENYVQEAAAARAVVGRAAKWHFIGHLQTNKVRRAVEIFDLIETVDSLKLGQELDKRCREQGKIMPVFIEINSGREPQKSGVWPEDAEGLIGELARLPGLKVEGLMTMGPETGDAEDSRPFFRLTKEIFDRLNNLAIPGVTLVSLSMGMSHSYRLAVEEGANMVRLGTAIFGPRRDKFARAEKEEPGK